MRTSLILLIHEVKNYLYLYLYLYLMSIKFASRVHQINSILVSCMYSVIYLSNNFLKNKNQNN